MLVRTQIGGTVNTRKRFAYGPVALNMILGPEPQPLYGRAASQVGISGLPDSHCETGWHASPKQLQPATWGSVIPPIGGAWKGGIQHHSSHTSHARSATPACARASVDSRGETSLLILKGHRRGGDPGHAPADLNVKVKIRRNLVKGRRVFITCGPLCCAHFARASQHV
jgi:hypothetical protein